MSTSKLIGKTLIGKRWALAAICVISASSAALPHSWYPPRCCAGQDCMKVDKIDYLPNGVMRMHVGVVSVLVPREFGKLPSEDGDAHVCLYKAQSSGDFVPRCVFLPGSV